MTINCCEIRLGDLSGYVPSSLSELNKLKAGKLVKELREINKEYEPKRNFMVMSMNVFNTLEHHDKFEHLNLLGRKSGGVYLVGRIYEIDCYIDLHMMEDTILLSWDKQRAREMKLESLLNDSKKDLQQLKIDVIL